MQNSKLSISRKGWNSASRLIKLIQKLTHITGFERYLRFINFKDWPTCSDTSIIQFVKLSKAIKAWFLQQLSGYPNKVSGIEERIIRYHGNKYPVIKGIESFCLWFYRNKGKPLCLRRFLQCLNAYGCIVGSTYDQMKETLSELTSYQRVKPQSIELEKTWIDSAIRYIGIPFYEYTQPSTDIRECITTSSVAYIPGLNVLWSEYAMLPSVTVTPDNWVGNLAVVDTDPGNKLRLVGVSTPTTLLKTKGLQNYLLDILNLIPTDCTFNQENGRSYLQHMTLIGMKTISSIDCKDWTYHFPALLQMYSLKTLGVTQGEIDYVFNCVWGMPSKYGHMTDLVSFPKGQMMGMQPSFLMAALTHNLILTGMCISLKLTPEESFRVLGDDIIITDTGLYGMYMKFLQKWNIPISLNKTFMSPYFGEFGGRLYYKGLDVTPIKLSFPISIINYARWARYIGFRALSNLLSVRDKNVLFSMMRTSQDHGGFGIKGFFKWLPRPSTYRDVQNAMKIALLMLRLDDSVEVVNEMDPPNVTRFMDEDEFLEGRNLDKGHKAYKVLWKLKHITNNALPFSIDIDQTDIRSRIRLMRGSISPGQYAHFRVMTTRALQSLIDVKGLVRYSPIAKRLGWFMSIFLKYKRIKVPNKDIKVLNELVTIKSSYIRRLYELKNAEKASSLQAVRHKAHQGYVLQGSLSEILSKEWSSEFHHSVRKDLKRLEAAVSWTQQSTKSQIEWEEILGSYDQYDWVKTCQRSEGKERDRIQDRFSKYYTR